MKNQISILVVVLAFLISSCTPKTTEKIVEAPVEKKVTKVIECATFNDLGSKQEAAVTAFILYKDELKLKNYEAAYPLWQKAMRMAPKADGNKSYHYDDGVKLFTYFADQETDEANRMMWADSMKVLYARKAKCYGASLEMQSKQAYDMYYNFRDEVGDQYLYGLMKEIVDAKGNDMPEFLVNPFSNLIVSNVIAKDIEVDEAKKYANMVMDIIANGNATCGDDCKNWKIINDYSLGRLAVLERFPSFYPCDYYADKYYADFEAAPTDCDVIETVYARLKRGGCEDTDARLMEIKNAYDSNCKKVATKGPVGEAYDMYRSGDYEKAIEMFDAYFTTETDKEKLAKNQLLVAKIYYRDIKDFPKARKYALDAASNKANWGAPYVLIGKLYASSGPICGPGTGWKSQIVAWPAIDKWNYAKSIDPSVASEANGLIKTYQQYMPAVEDIFSRPNVKEGGSFYVGCWIKENTTARAAK